VGSTGSVPTEAAFRAAADAFDTAARDADALMTPAQQALTPDVLHGGVLTPQVQRALDDAAHDAAAVAAECRASAATCRQRAAVVHQYWADVAEWETHYAQFNRQSTTWANQTAARKTDPTLPDPGPPPQGPGGRPSKPQSWID